MLVRLKRHFVRFALSNLLAFTTSAGGQLPTLRIPKPFGINIHYLYNPDQELESIYRAGFRVVRADLSWSNIEKTKGVFEFAYYDTLIRNIIRHNLRPLLILDYSNALYEPKVVVQSGKKSENVVRAPQRPESREAFKRFAIQSLLHFRYADPIWEIWNEPEGAVFWPPAQNAIDYILLANLTCHAMREVSPQATIIGPAAGSAPTYLNPAPPFLKSVLQSDLANCLDAVSVHPYTNIDNLDWTPNMWADVRRLIPEAAHSLVPVSSEWGLSTYRYAGNDRFSDETQASYLVRMMLLNMADSIPVSIWYDWRDDGDDIANPEHRYGITTSNGTPKAAWQAMQVLTTLLAEAEFRCRIPDPNATQLVFFNAISKTYYLVAWASTRAVMWSAHKSSVLMLQTDLRLQRTMDMFGSEAQTGRGNRSIKMVGYQPFYSTIQSKSIPASCLGRSNN